MRTQLPLDFDASTLTVAPSPFLAARETSALAAVENLPRRATQNARILELITAAGDAGMSDAEIAAATGYCRATICARRGDLRPFLTVGARRAWSPYGKPMATWRRKTAQPGRVGMLRGAGNAIVPQRAMEIADELAPFIEDAVGWDDAAVPAPEREAVRVLIALFDAMAEDWLTQADNIRLQRGQHTRVKDGHEVLAACAYTIKDKLAALRAEGEGER